MKALNLTCQPISHQVCESESGKRGARMQECYTHVCKTLRSERRTDPTWLVMNGTPRFEEDKAVWLQKTV